MPVYDFICKQCGSVHFDVIAASPEGGPFCCHKTTEWLPSMRQITVPVHASERSVVWKHPQTGAVKYPARNDVPVPEYYARQGFQRVEIEHDNDMRKFEKEHGVTNEKAHYDRNGRGHELPIPEAFVPIN